MNNKKHKEDLVRKTIESLDTIFIDGSYDYMNNKLPELADRMQQTENYINELVKKQASINELKKALRIYWKLHVELIELFTKTDNYFI